MGVSERQREGDVELADLIRRMEYGKWVSRKKAVRLMRENGLNARVRRKFVPTTNSNYGLPVCGSVLNREFHAESPERNECRTLHICAIGEAGYI
jgi:transposase InsO family protein